MLSGLEPDDDPPPDYTIPAIRFDDGEYVMKSENIIGGIEKRYPSPSLHTDSPSHKEALRIVAMCLKARPDIVPRVCYNLLNPPSQEYFERTRSTVLGVSSLRDMQTEEIRRKAWSEAEEGFQRAIESLKKDPEGPYFMGNTRKSRIVALGGVRRTDCDVASYADLIFVSFLQFLRRCDQSLFDKAVAFDPVIKANYDACSKWLERDDH